MLLLSWVYRRWVEVLSVHTEIRLRKRVGCGRPLQELSVLTESYCVDRNLELTQAIVYQLMYNVPDPSVAVDIQNQARSAIQIAVPVVAIAEVCA